MATVNLDCKLDLKTIAFHARNVEYNPKVRNPKLRAFEAGGREPSNDLRALDETRARRLSHDSHERAR